jgi:hypothetical protein
MNLIKLIKLLKPMNSWWPKIITPPPPTREFKIQKAGVGGREGMDVAGSHGGDIPRPAEEILAVFSFRIGRIVRNKCAL